MTGPTPTLDSLGDTMSRIQKVGCKTKTARDGSATLVPSRSAVCPRPVAPPQAFDARGVGPHRGGKDSDLVPVEFFQRSTSATLTMGDRHHFEQGL